MAITPKADTPRRDVANEGEHPLVVVHDIIGRSRPKARIIAVANEKGGVGKSTLAFHTAIALCDAGYKVAVLDLDPRQQSVARTLAFREATAKRLSINLPSPTHTVFRHSSGAMLCQELVRIGWQADYILLDVAGSDSPLARRAIALADTLLTPINASFVDLDLLGRFNPTTHELLGPAFFARMVNEIRDEKVRRGMNGTDWIVVPNRLRGGAAKGPSVNQQRFDAALAHLAPVAGFRIGRGMSERVAYRELFLLGLTHLDLPRVPQLADMNSAAPQEIANLLEDLALLPVQEKIAVPA
ncbi:hypothetical protein EOE18_14205 [Novosphingobium umbonatum]|uniref:ATPase n=2 Tax=Novosphingobium umbonatum TaxID=1908524 RepID=A0A437N1V6_9SPHN|nr:hypothetical protein EOE18_14205 [Novosphingobium umbonatum]